MDLEGIGGMGSLRVVIAACLLLAQCEASEDLGTLLTGVRKLDVDECSPTNCGACYTAEACEASTQEGCVWNDSTNKCSPPLPTRAPTATPTTREPTAKPTGKPTPAKPTRKPTAARPTPTGKPTTAKPTRKPTTAKPTREPTTAKPTSPNDDDANDAYEEKQTTCHGYKVEAECTVDEANKCKWFQSTSSFCFNAEQPPQTCKYFCARCTNKNACLTIPPSWKWCSWSKGKCSAPP
jgi:hypothetical protein